MRTKIINIIMIHSPLQIQYSDQSKRCSEWRMNGIARRWAWFQIDSRKVLGNFKYSGGDEVHTRTNGERNNKEEKPRQPSTYRKLVWEYIHNLCGISVFINLLFNDVNVIYNLLAWREWNIFYFSNIKIIIFEVPSLFGGDCYLLTLDTYV